MPQLEQIKVCYACGVRFDCLKEGRSVVTDTHVRYFCPKHKNRSLRLLAKALVKYYDVNECGLPRVPLEIYEYKSLLDAGVI